MARLLDDAALERPWWRRLSGGAQRRARHWWRRLAGGPDVQTVPLRIERLQAAAFQLAAASRDSLTPPDALLAREILTALSSFGARRASAALAVRLAAPVGPVVAQSLPGAPLTPAQRAKCRDDCRQLMALRAQVHAAFTTPPRDLPDQIDSADGRVQIVRELLQALGDGPARVADVGCGPGRFIRALQAEFPHTTWTGIDPSPALLELLPEGVERRQGELLRLPAADGEFDAALAVESLEHALWPEQAVRELCRIVRPGGRLLIIDKHAAWQPLSEHAPWERWFEPVELVNWLSVDCRDVSCTPVAHGRHASPTGLFLGCSGVRK